MDRDAINPCLEAGLPVEVVHPAEDFEKNFLSGVGGVSGVGEDPIHYAIHGLVKFSHQPRICFLRTRLELLNNGGFLAADPNRAREISQTGGSRHAYHGDTPYYTSVGKPLLPEWLDNVHGR